MANEESQPPTISVESEQDYCPIDLDIIKRLAEFILAEEGAQEAGELSVTFVDRETIAGLNLKFRGKEGPTDVLSFTMSENDEDGFVSPVNLLGNVIVCPEAATEDVLTLTVHGVLHTLGYSHDTDDAERKMSKRQAELVERFGSETK